MLDWYVQTKKLIRVLAKKAADARAQCPQDNSTTPEPLKGYVLTDYQQLKAHWLGQYPDDAPAFRSLGRHVDFCMGQDCSDIMRSDLPELEERAEGHLQRDGARQKIGFEELLHPAILAGPYKQYRDGHLRNAVMDSITLLFDMIRTKAKCGEDGDRLVGKVFSTDNPILIFSELKSESGQNDQKGFMQILRGAYQGVRNPKAHSLEHDLNPHKAAQYLVFASLLARRIDEAKAVKTTPRGTAEPART